MCGDEFSGEIITKSRYSTKTVASKYCQKCMDVKGSTNARTFIRHAKKAKRRNLFKEDIIKALETDNSFTKHLQAQGWGTDRWVFLKEKMRIDMRCNLEMWDIPNGRKNRWRDAKLSEVSHRLPEEARKIAESNRDLF